MAKKMSKLKTEELTEILKQTTDIDVFLDDNELLPNVSLAEYINELVEEKKTKIADVARKAHMSSSYLYKLGEGKRKSPTRNKALQICFGLGLDIDESNELLKLADARLSRLHATADFTCLVMDCGQGCIQFFQRIDTFL